LITVRFRDFPEKNTNTQFIELVEMATGQKVKVLENIKDNVDLEIIGPYGGNSDSYKTPLSKRLKRLGFVTFTNGRHLARRDLSAGIQPSKNAKKSIWYTGENERPPQGEWDGYLTFDTKMPNERSAYFPLWFLTSTNLFASTKETYWGGKVPSLNDLMGGRKLKVPSKKFVATFIGKTYPMRLHAIELLSKLNKVDVFGDSVRNKVKVPADIAKNYRYVLCFENDIYPGYITEKPFEAYLAGTIPLYYGLDVEGFINPKAVINLIDYDGFESWINYIKEIENSATKYKKVYEQPLLLKRPELNNITNLIRKILEVEN
jgi:hypothetical protein